MPELDLVTPESAVRDAWFLRSVPLGGAALSQALQRLRQWRTAKRHAAQEPRIAHGGFRRHGIEFGHHL